MKKRKSIFCFIFFVFFWPLFSNQKVHLSIDDVLWIFEDLSRNEEKYNSAFDNSILNMLKNLHEEYGAKFSLYCFYSSDNFDLSMATTKFKNEFIANKDWLKFGFHAYNKNVLYKDDFKIQIFYDNLLRIVGSKDCFTNILRLHFYSGDKQLINELKYYTNNNLVLLSADNLSIHPSSYYLDNNQMKILNNDEVYKDSNNVLFWMTDYRLEEIDAFDNFLKNNNNEDILVIFTHEKMLHNVFRKNIIAYLKDFRNKRIIKERLNYLCKEYSANYNFIN